MTQVYSFWMYSCPENPRLSFDGVRFGAIIPSASGYEREEIRGKEKECRRICLQ
uniref:hypothetical protein n=1 Tax=uncultured Dysgonomonas sp. TaxID=206096 RepID=UPI0026138A6B|nr:hypothetical protein [uncultured Dysgonomonas sp.]